jgi:hypothetical protein
MVANKTETWLSQRLKEDVAWSLKLQVNQLAHTPTPADFHALKFDDNGNLHAYLIEAKECSQGRLEFSRLTQMAPMMQFVTNTRGVCHAAFLISWHKKGMRWDKTPLYLVPVQFMYYCVKHWDKKSVKQEEFAAVFSKHLISDERLPLETLP